MASEQQLRELWGMIDDTANCFLKPEGPVKGLYFSHLRRPAIHTVYVPNVCVSTAEPHHQRDMTESRQWEVGLKFEKQKHRDFKQNYKWPSSFHLIPIYRKAKLWREQWFYVRWLIMVFNKLFPAKNTVFSGHWSCVSTAFSGSARLGLTHFFQIVPLQHSWDAFTWLLYHTGCNCDDINFEVTLTHRTTRGYPFLLHPYWQSNRNICTSRLQFAVSFAGCLCSMSDYSSGNSLEPISVFECFLTQPWTVVSAQLAWNLTRGDTKKGTKHQVLPT